MTTEISATPSDPRASRARALDGPLAQFARNRSRLLDEVAREAAAASAGGERRQGDLRALARSLGELFHPRWHRLFVRTPQIFANAICNVTDFGPFHRIRKDHLDTRIRVTGPAEQLLALAERGTVLLLPTHQTQNDLIVFGHLIDRLGLPPFAWGVASSLLVNPVMRFGLRRFGAFAIDRSRSPLQTATVKAYAKRLVQEGVHTLFFPAGGRIRSGAIEASAKLGLISAALDAHIEMLKRGHPRPDVFVVPVSVSWDTVLEAPQLIDEHLAAEGVPASAHERPSLSYALPAYVRHIRNLECLDVRFGEAMDITGDPVRDTAGAGGARQRFAVRGRIAHDPARDRELIEKLGRRVVDTFHRNHVVRPSQVAAWSIFEALRAGSRRADLASLLAAPDSERRVSRATAVSAAEHLLRQLRDAEAVGDLQLSPGLRASEAADVLNTGLARLELFHDPGWVRASGDVVDVGDPSLLYYYRNRLAGFGLSLASEKRSAPRPGASDTGGFLF